MSRKSMQFLNAHNLGQPIPEEAISDIFKLMSRHSQYAAGDYRSHSELRLGLYIASETAAGHQGRIDVASDADNGTTFYREIAVSFVRSERLS